MRVRVRCWRTILRRPPTSVSADKLLIAAWNGGRYPAMGIPADSESPVPDTWGSDPQHRMDHYVRGRRYAPLRRVGTPDDGVRTISGAASLRSARSAHAIASAISEALLLSTPGGDCIWFMT